MILLIAIGIIGILVIKGYELLDKSSKDNYTLLHKDIRSIRSSLYYMKKRDIKTQRLVKRTFTRTKKINSSVLKIKRKVV